MDTIYQVENGNGNPSYDTLTKIFEVLGLELTLIIKATNSERSRVQ
jgi:transcriptional regulator with XRE-family HTH domain